MRPMTAGETFSLIVGVALMKTHSTFQYAGRPQHVAATRALKRAKRPRKEVLSSPSRCLGAWYQSMRIDSTAKANKSFL